MTEFKRHDFGIDLQKTVDTLFEIIKAAESDAVTRDWARVQMTEILKVAFIPTIFIEDKFGVMK